MKDNQTIIGDAQMKDGWKVLSLRNCCDILDSKRVPITKSKREKGDVPYYGATGLQDYVKDYLFDEPLVLLGEDGAKWGAGENSAYKIDGKSWVNNHAHVLRPKRDLLKDEWLIYFLNYSDLQSYITGVTVPKLNQEKMGTIGIPVPTSLSDQQSIVEYLDSSFAKIDAMKANAEKALTEAKALFQASLKSLLEPKDGWTEKTLGEILNLRRGHDLTHAEMVGDDYPVAGSNGPIGSHNCCTPISPCITVGRSGSVGAVNIYDECWAHNTTLYIDDFKGNYPQYLYYLLYSLDLAHLNSGSAVPTLNRNFIHPLTVPFIEDENRQKEVVKTLNELKSKAAQLQSNYDQICKECDALKQALLKQVFE